ncbi:uncharacterized protein BDZ83DRAFT_767493 [Colletotrichum acutatum]|uniref:Uncharacterized protein n=1 Tax=Glomerella acutata TaxID=27357 RepID=A0AAD8X8X9_GLOAC|nr:uncharacterized protein BDZ83DRAFT_767493 [Colletotrichum acutatum]KAK1709123.1 hypothetical protein BDZ83DRAFT_767493 [Colletotrichum acutatum]
MPTPTSRSCRWIAVPRASRIPPELQHILSGRADLRRILAKSFPPVCKMPLLNTVESCILRHASWPREMRIRPSGIHNSDRKGVRRQRLHPWQDTDNAKNCSAETEERSHTAVAGEQFSDIPTLGGRSLVEALSVIFDGLLYDGLDFSECCMAKSISDTVTQESRPNN